jgi:protocatechuate 3,4-dioxygenase beta subunit
MSRRTLLIGALLIFAILGARVVKGCQARDPERTGASAAPASPRSVAGGNVARLRADVAPIPVEADPSPAGALRLRGLVLGVDERPAEGAVVSLGTTPPRTARTDRAGSFAFDKLAPGPYRLAARGGGAVGGPLTLQLNERSGPVTLRLKSAAAVEATAIDARSRKAVSGAALELRGDDVQTATTGPDGKLRFEGVRPGKYVVKASAPEHSPVLRSLTVADASAVERVTLELGSGASASGEVRDARGQPVPGIPVVAELTSTLVSLAEAREDGAVTDEHGRFRFAVLDAGGYRFVASDAAHPPASSSLIALDGAHDHDGIVIQLEDSARIAGQVVTRSGDPVPFAVVRAVVNEGTLGQVLARQTQCDDQGQFELGGLPRKPVDIAALHDSASSDTHQLNLRDTPAVSELVLALDADGAIAGTVVNGNDQPVADAVVLAEPSASASRSRAEVTLRGKLSALTDGAGKFELRGLRSGASYLLRAAPPGASLSRRTSWLRASTKVEVNGKTVVLRVDADGRLKGQVRREDGGAPELFSVTVDGASSFVGGGGTGEFHIPDVPPGTHTVTVSGPDFVTRAVQSVEIKADVEADVGVVSVAKGRRITGRVVREDGSPVAGATVIASKAMTGSSVVVGPAGAQMADARQTVSADDGAYSLGGMGMTPINLGAEHPGDGRSAFVSVPPGLDDVKLDLGLKATGALRGTVTQQGRPVSGALVLASVRGAPAGGTGATTGTDGSYAFDALTPGAYSVAAILDAGGGQNVKQSSVAIKPGDTARLDVELPVGTVTLVVHPISQGGGLTAPVRVVLTRSELGGPPRSAGAPPPAFQTQVVTGSDPARFSGVEPGMYRLCASLAPATGSATTSAEATKASCAFTSVAQGPSTQETSVAVPAR